MAWMITASGQEFDLTNPNPALIHIEDIAASLSKLCRFTGHCHGFYSVAQHSVLVSRIVPARFHRVALLHDATEAFVADISAPLKSLLPDYRAIEQRVWLAVAERFDLPAEIPAEVKRADLVALATEKRDIMPASTTPWPVLADIDPHPQRIKPLSPGLARIRFLERWKELRHTWRATA